MSKKKGWDILSKRNPLETAKYRDVYEDQQFERSKIQEKQSPMSRIILAVFFTIIIALATWVFVGIFSFGMHKLSTVTDTSEPVDIPGVSEHYIPGDKYGYIVTSDRILTDAKGIPIGGFTPVFSSMAPDGTSNGEEYLEKDEVPIPDWYQESHDVYILAMEDETIQAEMLALYEKESLGYHMKFRLVNLLVTSLVSLAFFSFIYQLLMRNLEAQNMMSDTSDINQYQNDQHIALPEEIQRRYDWFPDVGATSDVQPSSMISHMMLTNKGLNKVEFSKRATEDIYDEDGDIIYYKNEVLTDDNGNPITESVPLIDTDFAKALFEASDAPIETQSAYDTLDIPYNPNNENREKLKGYDTVAQLINEDWQLPWYEPQRPAGAYIVDTEPVNTMVLAITRAGKGQTVIEPTIDMWTRERRKNNMVINDPKGELLVDNYVKGTVRGFQPVQFNLINVMKTDIYNPLLMAAESAREGDFMKCAIYVENIADVFFPLDGGEDPVWPNAANNAFKRAAYGLIDYYLEEEKELRLYAEAIDMEPKILETKLDELWGKVTLYNCYQLFVQLTSKKLKNPAVEFAKKAKNNEFDDISNEEYDEKLQEVEEQAVLWEDKPEIDLLTLYFNATRKLPKNQMRTLIDNADSSLRSMSGAEKMMASVYGIAITAMSFFTDPTISTLTSGAPSQNVDLAGLSFPRRVGVRFTTGYLERYRLVGLQAKWQAFSDPDFEDSMGEDYYHEDMVGREGWARYYFKGIFPTDEAYLRLQIVNPSSHMLVKSFYFHFTKSYQTSLDGRTYVKDPILDEKIVKNGIIEELIRYKKKDGSIGYRRGHVTYPDVRMKDIDTMPRKEKVKANAIVQTMVRYAEKPKMVFLVTPPHLMKYAKLILILIKQLVDLNFDQSYMTKSDQKPLYKTRFMLDELGNLQSEGHGISGFETMLSIGLGQEQQFTLILQTLQQLRDVYGDSVDKIVQGNTSNIVFLKSTDDSMIDTLQKMSGTTHRTYTDSKTVTRDMEKLWLKNEGKASYTMTTREEPVIKYNDMAFISPRNSIIFRAGDSPIWNRNETILPMSWRLFQNTITHPGHKYTFQTMPTLSTAKDFDVRKNQPDFNKMLDKRMAQSIAAMGAREVYQSIYGYTDHQIEQLDPDDYADEIMEVINISLREDLKKDDSEEMEDYNEYLFDEDMSFSAQAEDNPEQEEATAKARVKYDKVNDKRFAGGLIAPNDLVSISGGSYIHSLDKTIISVYTDIKGDLWKDDDYFTTKGDGNLYGINGECYIRRIHESEDLAELNKAAKDEDAQVFGEEDINEDEINVIGTYEVTNAFLKFLSEQESWDFANGKFEQEMARRLRED